MASISSSLYDAWKDRRYASFFLACLFGFIGVVLLGFLLYALGRAFHVDPKIVWAAPCLAALLRVGFLLARKPPAGRGPPRFPPLSRDELRRARSKLVNGQSRRIQ
jgi:hypothetical protein